MPVTRRAPYVAIAIWAGGFDNVLRKRPDEFVGVGDMKHDIDKDTYAKRRAATVDRVSAVRNVLHEQGVVTGISFTLIESLRPVLGG